jgi:2-dehydro-3-deoxyphosphogluconate aldolase/(4S)-4-hydroxy-2-oxoglutarate aldolase
VIGRVVSVLTAETADDAERACEAILAGGLTSVEIVFRSDTAVEAIRRASRIDGLIVGAGTVLSVQQLEAAVEAGATFAVAPTTDPVVIEAAHRAGVRLIPGVATPTEIGRARSLGCDVVKLFPASLIGGPAFIKAVSPVFPDVKFVPTGGITVDNLGEYLALPSVLACGGTWITAQIEGIEERARAAALVAA